MEGAVPTLGRAPTSTRESRGRRRAGAREHRARGDGVRSMAEQFEDREEALRERFAQARS